MKLDITATDQVLWTGEAIASKSDLESRMQLAAAQSEQPEIHLLPNKDADTEENPPGKGGFSLVSV